MTSLDLKTEASLHRSAGARIFYRICQFLLQILGIVLFDYRQFGVLRVPRRGATILASNHQSYLDPLLVGLCQPRRAFYVARESLFRFFGFRKFLSLLNAIPIPRGAFCRRGLDLARGVLHRGELLVVFPEGTRTPDGKMGPLKRGIELLTNPTGAAVVPVYIHGAFQAWPRGGGFRFHPIRVFFGTSLECGVPGTDKEDVKNEAAGAGGPGGENGSSVDLPTRLLAAYRNLEAEALKVHWVGAAGSCGRLGYFG